MISLLFLVIKEFLIKKNILNCLCFEIFRDIFEVYGGFIYGYNSWLNYVICDGLEIKLEDCRYSVWGYY